MRWEILKKGKGENVVDVLLENRGIKDKRKFLAPKHPSEVSLDELGIDKSEISKAVARIERAKKKDEGVIVYGDYDADGVTATAIMWEALYSYGVGVMPYIPDRFEEGYGLNAQSVKSLKSKNPELKLIVTVDNGIVANKAVEEASKLGVDVIITDHHQAGKKLPKAEAIVHSTRTSGSAIAWVLATRVNTNYRSGLDLVAIGTIADLMPLVEINRSFVKHGIAELNKTRRAGLLAMFGEAAIKTGTAGTYEIGYLIAPRINASGRMGSAVEALRLLCTKKASRGEELALEIGKANNERQKLVEELVAHAMGQVIPEAGPIVIWDPSYHEGVIGLVASKLVERHYRPAIVISTKSETAKASARSISGFNIIEKIREVEDLIIEGGGHPMAAGFSIERNKIEEFVREFGRVSRESLSEDMLERRLKIDMEIEFGEIDIRLIEEINKLEPFGVGNSVPVFASMGVSLVEAKLVGKQSNHIKMKLEQDGVEHSAIAFGMGNRLVKIEEMEKMDVAYRLQINEWNGRRSVDLVIKDVRPASSEFDDF